MDLSYLPHASEGHMFPTDEVLSLWKDIKQRTDFKHIFEIGTNGGHSAAIIMTLFPDVKVTSMDIGWHSYTAVAVEALKAKFGDRFTYMLSDTKQYLKNLQSGSEKFPEGIDIINIDGDHSVQGAINDIQIAKFAKLKHIMIDDFVMYGVPAAYAVESDGLKLVNTYQYYYYNNPVTMALVTNELV